MDTIIKLVAKLFILIPAVVAIYFWWKVLPAKERKNGLISLVSLGILSLIIAMIAQHLYVNPRPPYKDGSTPLFQPSDYNGFPSDHTLFASVVAFWLMRYSRRLGLIMLGVALVIGWARVAAHVHHAIDVFAAVLIVGLAYLAIEFVKPKLLKEKTTKAK